MHKTAIIGTGIAAMGYQHFLQYPRDASGVLKAE